MIGGLRASIPAKANLRMRISQSPAVQSARCRVDSGSGAPFILSLRICLHRCSVRGDGSSRDKASGRALEAQSLSEARLMLMGPIAMSHPIVMVVMVMATARSQKAAPISPISPIRFGRRRCIKPREVLLLKTISKLRGAGLKPVASASRLVLAAKFLRRDARPGESERTAREC